MLLRIWCLVVTAALVTACTRAEIDPRLLSWVPAERGIELGRDFGGGDPTQVRYSDDWQDELYVLWQEDGAQMELIYAAANPNRTVALQYDLTSARQVLTWAHNASANIAWGEGGRFGNRWRNVFYQRYRLGECSCFGFSSSWDRRSEDPRVRPNKVLFGYYCAPDGSALDEATIERLVWGIRLAPDRHAAKRDLLQGAAALAFARGGDAEGFGNPGYPFRLARYYRISNGGPRR